MYILSFESSFDDLCFCLLKIGKKIKFFEFSKNYSIRNTIPFLIVKKNIKNIKLFYKKVSKKIIKKTSVISYTYKPGLVNSLNISKYISIGISKKFNIPILKVNHIKGHIFSSFFMKKIIFPFISLIISGGNTFFIKVNCIYNYKIIDKTVDISIGDFIDRIFYMIGEKEIKDKIIYKKYKIGKLYVKNIKFKITKTINFSGILSYFKKFFNNNKNNKFIKEKICYILVEYIIFFLFKKIKEILKNYGRNIINICGGVIENKLIRYLLKKKLLKEKIIINFSKPNFCKDNALMIAYFTFLKFFYKFK
ncbi:hypothetical protein ACT2CR_00185 [Candidatus Vidania fulgoroideorum]